MQSPSTPTSMYNNVSTAPSVNNVADDNSVVPCDLPDPVWNKMSVASSGVKKRKKPDSKPQSQINKCLNEKRRREQENIFIEELAELISVTFSDMNSLSVKPDKCAILQETVHQIRNIKQQQQQQLELQQQHNQQNQQGVVSTDDIQQGEVSSSKPTVLSNEIFGPLLLEALEGFAFLLNHEGKVEYVTDNVSQFIKYSKDEILGRSIYSIIHQGDHARFSSCLLPSVGNWSQSGSGGGANQLPKNRPFNCRLLVKPSDDSEESVSENTEPTNKYEHVQISSTLLKGEGTYVPFQISSTLIKGDGASSGGNNEVSSECGEMGPGVICVARRIPANEKQLTLPGEQFTTRLDTSGKILAVDTSGVSATYSLYLNKELVGKLLQELCYVGDLPKLNNHLKETLIRESHLSTVYKIMVSPDKYVQIRTKSRLYKGGSTNEGDFIMATHSIVGESDEVCQMIESTTLSNTHHSSTSGSHGGGPMVNAMNGRLSAVSTPDNSNTMTLSGGGGSSGNNNQSTEYSTMSDLSVHDFEFFPTSNYDMEDRTPWPDRPESRHSLTSAPSPLNPFSHVSPAPNPPSTPFSAGLPFSPLDSEKDGKEMMMADVAGMSENCESARLRNLLTNKKSNADADDVNANRKQILENLLNNDGGMEMDGGAGDAGPSPGQRMPMTPSSMSGSDSSSYNKSGQNLMLLKLLNKKGPENDDSENKHEYLQKLLKPEDKHELSAEQEAHQQPPHQQSSQSIHHIQAEDTILKGIGFMSSPTSPTETANRLRKRPSEEIDEIGIPTKKITILDSIPPPPPIPVANSKLQEKNKMLMSLLAKQPTTPATIPHLPPSVISATPQDRLPKILTSATPPVRPSTIWSNSGNAQQQQQIRVPHQQQRANANMAPRGGFLNELLQPQQQQQQQQQHQQQLQQQQHIQQQLQNQIKLTTNNNNILPWEPLAPAYNNDDDLSKLLDQLFENVPDAVITEPTIMSLISSMEQGEGLISNTDNSMGVNNVTLNNAADSSANVEKMAIHAIKNSFMSYEQQSAISNRMQLNQTLMQQQQQQLQQQQQRQQQPQPPQQAINPSAQQQFPPPPMYQQRPNRLQIHQNSGQLANRPMTPQYAVTTSTGPYSLQQQEQYRKQYLQQHQKRLLAQQQLQQIIPSNAAANSQVSTSLQSMDSLLNNSAPPNVSLQRSTSLTSEASNTQQLSPGGNNPIYNNAMMNSSQISPPQRQPPSSLSSPYSPLSTNHQQQQSFSSLNFTGANNQPSPSQAQGARSSPSGLSPFQAQLSPRVSQPQTTFTGSSVMSSGAQAQVQQQQNAWSAQTPQQQMVNNRLSLQQQQNPMLDARLSNAGYAANNRATLFAQQPQKSQQAQSPQLSQVRGLTSPSPRQSPFPADISPTTATSYVSAAAASQQQYRLQRAMSMPGNANMPTSQVPSGNNCIRAYPSNMGASLNHKDSSQTPSHPPPLYSPVMYPHHGESSPYCYPEQSLPMYGDRSRVTHSSGNNNVNNNNAVGDYVRQELRAVVGARQQGMRAPSVDLESLGLSFEMPSADNDGSKWGSLSADVNEGSSSAGLSARTSLDDVMRAGIGTNPNNMNQMSNVGGGGEKSSLLQKLLSE